MKVASATRVVQGGRRADKGDDALAERLSGAISSRLVMRTRRGRRPSVLSGRRRLRRGSRRLGARGQAQGRHRQQRQPDRRGTHAPARQRLGLPVYVDRHVTADTLVVLDRTAILSAYGNVQLATSFNRDSIALRVTFRFGQVVADADRVVARCAIHPLSGRPSRRARAVRVSAPCRRRIAGATCRGTRPSAGTYSRRAACCNARSRPRP